MASYRISAFATDPKKRGGYRPQFSWSASDRTLDKTVERAMKYAKDAVRETGNAYTVGVNPERRDDPVGYCENKISKKYKWSGWNCRKRR